MKAGLRLLLVLSAALAACGDSETAAPAIGLSFPSAVAVFHGYTQKSPTERRPYLAVANAGRGDLSLVDAVDDRPVVSPILVRALSVPTLPGPLLLAAAPLGDGAADLLVVAVGGGAAVQLVETWSPANRVVLELDLTADAAGAQILSLAAVPAPAAGNPPVAVARVVAGLAGGRIVVLDFARGDEGAIVLAGRAAQNVGFDAVSITSAPDLVHLYAATPDDVPAGSGVYGVVELDTSTAPGAWATSVLPTRAPTRLVAAFRLMERVLEDSEIFSPTPVDRVYAALDPSACGASFRIDCGIAVIDPSPGVRGLLPDPLGEMPHLPPIRVPGQPVALTVSPPPARPPTESTVDRDYATPYMRVIPSTGARPTTGVLAVPTTFGRVYWVDLARRTVLNDRTMLRPVGGGETRTRADGLVYTGPTGTQQVLAVVACDDAGTCDASRDPNAALDAVEVTPGYTYDDTWRLEYQGDLPELAARSGETGSTVGRVWVAVQGRNALGSGLVDVARVYDPALGVHAGDLVTITSSGIAECPASFDATVEDFAVPDLVRYPGGALYLAAAADPAAQACLARLGAGATGLGVWIRAQGFLFAANAAGYAGRGEIVSPAPDLRVRARLQYENEDALVCPLSPWPAQPDLVTCLGACRDACERLALSRKSRRIYNVADSCNTASGTDAECVKLWGHLTLPNARGPVVAVEVAHRFIDPAQSGSPPAVDRNLRAVFQTASGIWPSSRAPLSGAPTLPTGAAAFDRSPYLPGDGYRFFVSYLNDFVLDFSPSQTLNIANTIR